MTIDVIKSTGLSERFDVRKLAESLIRSGATREVAMEIAGEVAGTAKASLSTKAIFRMAKRLLRRRNRASGMRYSLKKALYGLGPAGYRFEHYIGRVLKAHGYETELNRVVQGLCVSHEVDVVARKGAERFVIECKYHNHGGIATDVKVALYVHSRHLDIRQAFDNSSEGAGVALRGWLVTNTRCTSDALRYSECVGLKVMSWRYPDGESLERMIESLRLYPVTILPAARKKALETLFQHDIVLAREIADMDDAVFLRRSGLDAETAGLLKQQASELCHCD